MVRKLLIPVSGMLILHGCGPVAYQPKPIAYNNISAQQQVVSYDANPFIQHQASAPTQQIAVPADAPKSQVEQKTKTTTKTNKMKYTKKETQPVESNVTSVPTAPQVQLGISANRYSSQITDISYEQCGISAIAVSIKNQSLLPIYIDITQFSATTAMGEVQPYMPIDVANIAMNSEGFNQALRGAGEGAVAGAAGGALLGGLAAVALGLKFSDGAGLGAVSGGIGGIGGGAAAYRQRFTQSIASEIESKKFTSRNIYPNTTVTGVLFFPAGISGLKLHLPTKTVDIGFAY